MLSLIVRSANGARLPAWPVFAVLWATSLMCSPALAQSCANPDVLGTSRVLMVGTQGGGEVGRKTYPQALKLEDHEVVLTFDDGPSAATTPAILAALKQECARATFFIVGLNAEANPALVRQEAALGHTIAHHSMTHPGVTLRGLAHAAGLAEIEKGIAADIKAQQVSQPVPFFRFPGFADTPELRADLAQRNIMVFGADLWASDWALMSPQKELELTMLRLEQLGRGIILFHDTRAQTAAMLPEFLRQLKKRGFHVVHIVPGPGKLESVGPPPGWRSETEAILARVMPKLAGVAKPNKLQSE